MLYKEYKIYYYINRKGKEPVREYIEKLSKKEQLKIFAYTELLRDRKGYLDEPYSKHIKGKIRELRVDFGRKRHRIFYFAFVGKKIILLHAFLKKSAKTSQGEIDRAADNYKEAISNQNKYE